MRHLNDEAIARLVDEPGEPHEAEHLRECLVCRRELMEMRAQTRALSELADPPLPSAAWDRLEARLRDEGLLSGAAPARPGWVRLHGIRAAAAVALFLLGGAAGAALWRPAGPEAGTLAQLPGQNAARTSAPSDGGVEAAYEAPALGLMGPAPSSASPPSVRLASTAEPEAATARTRFAPPPRAAAPRPAPVRVTRGQAEQAARELVQAQAAYVDALQRYTAIADPASGNDAETRMAALDQLIQLTGAALERTPEDPVINGYHLSATAERDRLRRELARDGEADWF